MALLYFGSISSIRETPSHGGQVTWSLTSGSVSEQINRAYWLRFRRYFIAMAEFLLRRIMFLKKSFPRFEAFLSLLLKTVEKTSSLGCCRNVRTPSHALGYVTNP